jgi:hypothetical protein
MIKKTYTFTDYNGNERTEDYYFDLRQDELVKLEYSTKGGLSKKIETLIGTQDIPEIIKVFDEIIIASYGVKSPDGREFIKDEAITKAFMQTKGYEKLFMDFVTKEGFAADFFNNLIPTEGITQVVNEKKEESNIVEMTPNT